MFPRYFIMILVGVVLLSCQTRQPQAFTGSTMGTRYLVKVSRPLQKDRATEIRRGVKSVLDKVNGHMSTYVDSSTVSRFNQITRIEPFELDAWTAEVVKKSLQISKLSDGAFDITVSPVVELWGFGRNKDIKEPPDPKKLAALRASVGYEKLIMKDPQLIKQDKNLKIDLSAIAKGYAVDKVAEYLESQGLKNYLIEIGGELKARGMNYRGAKWQIGIEAPSFVPQEQRAQWLVQLDNLSMATSGNYRNFFVHEGKRYSHTIDPRTLSPVTHQLGSVSVFHESCAIADAWATALLVLGSEAGYKVAVERKLMVLFVEKDAAGFKVLGTPAFNQTFPGIVKAP